MDERDKALILEFKNKLPSDLKKHLKRLIVFGSRAKGEAEENSDLDVIALVDEKTPDIEKKFDDIVYQTMWDHDFNPIISLKLFAESEFNNALRKGFSFYKNIEQEGVSV